MKQNLYILLTILCAACLTACDTSEALDPGFHADGDGGQVITVQIPEYPTAGTRAAGDKTAWLEGDVIYIGLVCWDDAAAIILQTAHIAQRTADGGWEFNKPLTVSPAASSFGIYAYYTSGTLPGEAIMGDLLQSTTGSLADNTTVTLNPFQHRYSRITFTGLNEGDKIEFKGNGWWHSKLDDNYERGAVLLASITADATKNAVLYAEIYASDANYPCTYEFRILPGGIEADATGWYTFDPGEPNEGTNHYFNRTYTIDCERLRAEGGNTPGSMEEEEKTPRTRFLDWAQSDRWKTEDFTLTGDIDLTGVDFEPIGTSFPYFTKTFDGGGHTISGLTVETSSYGGLFFYIVTGGTVRNLTVEGNITGDFYTGGIAGRSDGIISGCTFSGTATGSSHGGGIAGTNKGLIAGCRVTQSTITGAIYAGGITGYNSNGEDGIIACLADGVTLECTGTGIVHLGGITGNCFSPITACVTAPVSMTSSGYPINAGGIAGGYSFQATGPATACYWQTGSGYSKAIASDTFEQEPNCTGFAAGEFDAAYVDVLNAAITAYNTGQTDEAKKCKHRWKVSETAGGVPGLVTD